MSEPMGITIARPNVSTLDTKAKVATIMGFAVAACLPDGRDA